MLERTKTNSLGEFVKQPSRYGRIRSMDCYYAELLGYEWLELKSTKLDFKGAKFSHVLTSPGGVLDGAYVLEPDTRVPCFTSSPETALELARAFNLDTKKYLDIILADVDAHIANSAEDLA